MKKNSLFIFFLTIFLSLLVFSCSDSEATQTTSINIRIPVKSIVSNNSYQSPARAAYSADGETNEDNSTYELKITLNVDGQDLTQSAQGTLEELSDTIFTFSDLQEGAIIIASCDILKENTLIWTGKSESTAISEGINNVEITMKKVQQDEPQTEDPPIKDPPVEDPPIEEHKHTFSEKWSSNKTHHWHSATCEHKDEEKDKDEHTWDDGVITKEPKVGIEGEMTYTCTVCAQTKKEKVSALEAAPEGVIEMDYPALSILLMSSEGVELQKDGADTYQAAPMQKIKIAVKNSSGDDITMTSSTITLYHNGEEVEKEQSTSNEAVTIFIPHDAVGEGYTFRITVTTSNKVSYDKIIPIEIVEDLDFPESDKQDYSDLYGLL